jgi:hypothetical protein
MRELKLYERELRTRYRALRAPSIQTSGNPSPTTHLLISLRVLLTPNETLKARTTRAMNVEMSF